MRASLFHESGRSATLTALAAQIAGLSCAIALAALWHALGASWSIELLIALQALAAAALGIAFGMASWWICLHLVFAPTLLFALTLSVPPAVPGLLFVALLALYGAGTLAHRIPLFLSNARALRALESMLPQGQFALIDLGAGGGGVLSAVRQQRPQARLEGIECAPLPFVIAWLRGRARGFAMRYGNFWERDLGSYDVVYAYLSPAPMRRLWSKALQEMQSGAVFISNSFEVAGVAPTAIVRYGASASAVLYVWRMN